MKSTPSLPALTWPRMNQTVMTALMLILCSVFLLSTMAALNGGTALTASVWDPLKTWLSGMLTSTWVIVIVLVVLLACLWQLMHGRGYAMLSVVLGILAVALIGPGLVTTIATATGEVTSITAPPVVMKAR